MQFHKQLQRHGRHLRLPSQFIGPWMKANAEQTEKRQDPSDTRLISLIPAGLSALLRSQPIRPPRTAAIRNLRPKEHSSGVRNSKATERVLVHIRWS